LGGAFGGGRLSASVAGDCGRKGLLFDACIFFVSCVFCGHIFLRQEELPRKTRKTQKNATTGRVAAMSVLPGSLRIDSAKLIVTPLCKQNRDVPAATGSDFVSRCRYFAASAGMAVDRP
jgi:hypothetical protein